MDIGRRERIRARLQAVMAQESTEPLSLRLCQAAPTIVGVDGAGVSLISDANTRAIVAASDPWAAELESLQLEVGEGPCLRATMLREMIFVPDIRSTVEPALVMYARRVAAYTDVQAVFGFPIAVGTIAIGALDLYRFTPGHLPPESVAAAVMLADFLALAVLSEHAGSMTEERELEWLAETPDSRAWVHQATGVLIAQLDVNAEEAFALLRAHAFRADRRLTDVARDVIDHAVFLTR